MDVDAVVMQLAERQHGLVAQRQAIAAGMTRSQIHNRKLRGLWEQVRFGVYRIRGAPRSWPQTVMSAVLAAGISAWASHHTAARLWGLLVPRVDHIEVSIWNDRQVRIPGVVAHRTATLGERDIASASSIPVTSPARTLADLSSILGAEGLGRALDDGLRRGIVSLHAMHSVSQRLASIAPGRSPKTMRAVLADRIPGYEIGDSDLETRVWNAIRNAGLPTPDRLHRVRIGHRTLVLDLAYPAQRVAIEVDGFAFHGTRTAFETDRLRQNDLVLEGWTVLRFTSRSTDEQIVTAVSKALFGQSVA